MRPQLRLAILLVLFHSLATAQSPDKAAKIDQLARQYADFCEFTGTVLVTLPYYHKDIGSRVTITQLLDHTSGIPSYTDDPKFFPDESRNYYAVDNFVGRFCSGDLQFEPGSKFHYDNSGYFILGAILEHVTGKKYEVLLQEKILTPVDMHDTGYDHWSTIILKRASGYSQTFDGIVNAPYLDMALPYAAGSLFSTVEDLYKWDQALYTDELLPADLKQKLFTPNLEDYGFGWVIHSV